MAEAESQPAYLRRDGRVQIGENVFTVNNMRVDNIIDNHVTGERTVDMTIVLVSPIPGRKSNA